MRNNTRRNRNIGTAKQGYGQNNRLVIPEPLYKDDYRSFYERLGEYKKTKCEINGHEFVFIIEQLLEGFDYACTIDDLIEIIKHIPVEDYGELKFIVFRQPKRKERILSSVCGRLIYSYEFEDDYYPAIILEAFAEDKLLWPKKISVEGRREFERLISDGHKFVEEKRDYSSQLSKENVRSTQLYRTVLHEFGHYVHYLKVVERPGTEDEEFEEREKRIDYYYSIPSSEREKYAHAYADKLGAKLKEENVIPFQRKETKNDLEINQ